MNINYQLKLDEIIKKIIDNNSIPTLLLHSCCAPCSSYVLEYLSNYFKITIFYYNPNITDIKEYEKRVNEQQKLISLLKTKYPISFIKGNYNPETFLKATKGYENEPEGGKRCEICYQIRLEATAKKALSLNFDFFTTTLSISPYKNSNTLNEIGKLLEQQYDIKYLYADFKKKNGYQKSILLSKKYNLYRQDYCGCSFSFKEALKRTEKTKNHNITVLEEEIC